MSSMPMRKLSSILLVLVTGATFASACGKSQPASAPVPTTAPGKKVDAATAGTISGTVSFVGTPPAPDLLKLGSDPACVQEDGPTPPSDAVLVSKDGMVANSFVFIEDGLDPAYTFDVPTTPVELDQKGCRYRPRVLGIRAGQTLAFVNNDATLHNVHAMPTVKGNKEFNKGQFLKGQRDTTVFESPEVMVHFKCDVHGWMAAYIGVMAHPYFAVTGADGKFELKGVPPGTYAIEAWHEKFGTRTAKLTLDASGNQTVSFRFGAE